MVGEGLDGMMDFGFWFLEIVEWIGLDERLIFFSWVDCFLDIKPYSCIVF
jgi:hypothetical protein